MYLNVQEGQHKWTEHLEKNLGGFLLSGYLVTNREDNIKLKVFIVLQSEFPGRNLIRMVVCICVCVCVCVCVFLPTTDSDTLRIGQVQLHCVLASGSSSL